MQCRLPPQSARSRPAWLGRRLNAHQLLINDPLAQRQSYRARHPVALCAAQKHLSNGAEAAAGSGSAAAPAAMMSGLIGRSRR
jgi:hypothetical protein